MRSSLSCIAILWSRACLSSFSSSCMIWSSYLATYSLHSPSYASRSSFLWWSDLVSIESSLIYCSALAFSAACDWRMVIVALNCCSSFAACSLSCFICYFICSTVCSNTALRLDSSWQQLCTPTALSCTVLWKGFSFCVLLSSSRTVVVNSGGRVSKRSVILYRLSNRGRLKELYWLSASCLLLGNSSRLTVTACCKDPGLSFDWYTSSDWGRFTDAGDSELCLAFGGANDFMLLYCYKMFSSAFYSALDCSEDWCLGFAEP